MPENRFSMNDSSGDNASDHDPDETPHHASPEPSWFRYEEYLGVALKLLRIKFGIRQGDLAAMLSAELAQQVSQGYISRIECSKRGITHSRLALICKLLDCTPSRVIAMAESLATNAPHSGMKELSGVEPVDFHDFQSNGRVNHG